MARLLSGFKCRRCGAILPIEFEKSIKKLIRVKCERCNTWNSIIDHHTSPLESEIKRVFK